MGETVIGTAGSRPAEGQQLLQLILSCIDDSKAIDPVTIDLAGKSSIADHMVVASGSSQRHVASMAENLLKELKAAGYGGLGAEGLGQCDWVLIDVGDVIVHLFRPDVRSMYDLERLWGISPPVGGTAATAGA